MLNDRSEDLRLPLALFTRTAFDIYDYAHAYYERNAGHDPAVPSKYDSA